MKERLAWDSKPKNGINTRPTTSSESFSVGGEELSTIHNTYQVSQSRTRKGPKT